MKKYLIATVLFAIITGFDSCKKEKAPEKKAIITTVAGSSTSGFLDSTAALAKFYQPWDIAVSNDGTIYVTDMDNHRIRKIDINGRVTTFAGNGNVDVINGNGISAAFSYPCNIALDAAGNVYVTGLVDWRLRKITPQADVSVFAGTTSGYADGPVATARFKACRGIFVDAKGNVIVSDTENQRMRKISVPGQVTTFAGSGTRGFADSTALLAQFNNPVGTTSDRQGNIYVADYTNYSIRKITPNGIVSTLAGNGTQGFVNGKGPEARFHSLQDLVCDSKGNLYATDLNCIRKITRTGEVSIVAGSDIPGHEDGEGPLSRFRSPQGLAIDAAGNIYVADTQNHRIRKISFE